MLTAKQYLNQVPFLRSAIRRVEAQIEELRERAMSVGGVRYDKLNVQTSPSNDALANYAASLERAEQKARELVADYHETYLTIQEQIGMVQTELYRQVLVMRYLDGMNLERIADRLGYSDDWIRHVHGYALQEFSRMVLEGGDAKENTKQHI